MGDIVLPRRARKLSVLKRKKDDILIIQNSSIGTSASRRYQFDQTNYVEHNEWDNSTGTSTTEITSETAHVHIATNSYNGMLQNIPFHHIDK